MSKKHNKHKHDYDWDKPKKKHKHKKHKVLATVSKGFTKSFKNVKVDGTVTFNLPSGRSVAKIITGGKIVVSTVGSVLDTLSKSITIQNQNKED